MVNYTFSKTFPIEWTIRRFPAIACFGWYVRDVLTYGFIVGVDNFANIIHATITDFNVIPIKDFVELASLRKMLVNKM